MAYRSDFAFDPFASIAPLPQGLRRYKLSTGDEMRDYQVRAAHQLFTGKTIQDEQSGRFMPELSERIGTAIHIDPGLGKTIVALTAIADWYAFAIITKPVLVVAPIKVCETVWRQEAADWSHTRHLTFSLVRGDEKKRAFALARPAHIYLINPEMMSWLHKYMRGDWSRFHVLIIDESSMFKDNRSKRFRSITNYGNRIHVRDQCGAPLKNKHGDPIYMPPHRFRRVGILTGTPSPSGHRNLWAPFYICDHGARLHRRYDTFEKRYFHRTKQVAEHVWDVAIDKEESELRPDWQAVEGAPERIHELIADITVELNAADYGVLPQTFGDASKCPRDNTGKPIYLHTHHHRVRMPDMLRPRYDVLEKEAVLELQRDVLMAQNGGARTMMCWQFANGAIYGQDDFGRQQTHHLHNAKLDKACELVDMLNANILIPYWFKHDLARLKERFVKEGLPFSVLTGRKVEETIDRWNGGYIPVIFIHPQSAGHGLNLQFGGHTMIWYSLLWSLERYLQTIARLARSGQKYPVGIHHIITEATTDELMFLNLGERGDEQTRFRSALRSYQALRQLGLYAPSPFAGLGL